MILTLAELQKLNRQYPPVKGYQVDKHMHRIEKMAEFYTKKTPEAPINQQLMFAGFISALNYSHELVRAYADLAVKLDKLTKEIENENRTNS